MRCHWKKFSNDETTQCQLEATKFFGPSIPKLGYCQEHSDLVEQYRNFLAWFADQKYPEKGDK